MESKAGKSRSNPKFRFSFKVSEGRILYLVPSILLFIFLTIIAYNQNPHPNALRVKSSTTDTDFWKYPFEQNPRVRLPVISGDLNEVFVLPGSKKVWIAGKGGLIAHSSDGGATWNRQSTGTNDWLGSVHFTDVNNGWAVGALGTIIHTSYGGDSWADGRGKYKRYQAPWYWVSLLLVFSFVGFAYVFVKKSQDAEDAKKSTPTVADRLVTDRPIGPGDPDYLNHTPAVLAKQLATLDLISGGRLDFGIGLGWSEDEYIATNVPFKNRGDRVDEFLRCILNLWTEEVSEFDGAFYQVPRSIVNPKPVQKPHPPITVGGFNPRTFERAVNLGDGYNGIIMPFDQMNGFIEELKKAAEKSGRNFSDLQIVCRAFATIMDQSPGKDRPPLSGTVEDINDDLERCEEMGITEIFFDFNFEKDITTEKMLSHMEMLAPG